MRRVQTLGIGEGREGGEGGGRGGGGGEGGEGGGGESRNKNSPKLRRIKNY